MHKQKEKDFLLQTLRHKIHELAQTVHWRSEYKTYQFIIIAGGTSSEDSELIHIEISRELLLEITGNSEDFGDDLLNRIDNLRYDQ